MPTLKYYNPGTTVWEEISTAGAQGPPGPSGVTGPTGPTGAGTDEVVVGSVEPVDPAIELWVDPTDASGGVVTTAYVAKAGDAMIGPLDLITPTLLTNAARWADGTPRFADAAERDAAYATIGGPQAGMSCWLAEWTQQQTYQNGRWFPTGGTMPALVVTYTGGAINGGSWVAASVNTSWSDSGAVFVQVGAGGIRLPYTGFWSIDIRTTYYTGAPPAEVTLGIWDWIAIVNRVVGPQLYVKDGIWHNPHFSTVEGFADVTTSYFGPAVFPSAAGTIGTIQMSLVLISDLG